MSYIDRGEGNNVFTGKDPRVDTLQGLETVDNVMMNMGIEAWDSRVVKDIVVDNYAFWISDLADWKHFGTLTFRDPITDEKAIAGWMALVNRLNVTFVGKNYRQYVKHCYFAYVVGMEYGREDIPHFHFLADNYIDYRMIHDLWGEWFGFAWMEAIRSRDAVVSYISKYILKGGTIDLWMPNRSWTIFR